VAAVVLLYGGHLTLRGELSRAGLVSFMFYQGSLAGAMGTLSDIFSNLVAAVGAAVEVVRLLKRQPAHPEYGSLTVKDLKGHIDFQDVTFSYPTRPEVRVPFDASNVNVLCNYIRAVLV
jgi:ABC-type bacteriocin/lantibiotic exporter with double-glycine peptidase domain